jgi:Right handed beta helix region
LALVQQASGPGDTIVIEPSPASTPPLDGGIALKSGQRLIGDGPPVVQFGTPLIPDGPPVVGPSGNSSLPRITNTTNTNNSGDAVELASDTDVENLVIAGAYRGGIYGKDVVGVTLRGNDLSGFNTSGTKGFVVQPFYLESYTAGVANDVANGLPAGSAGILIDTANVSTGLSITNNYVHDGLCGDGIDIRGMNAGDISAQVDYNFVTRLVHAIAFRR